MQVKFSFFIIALSFLNYLFGVVIASPIPGGGDGSPRSSHIRSNSGHTSSSGQTHSSPTSSPVHRQATPIASESPKTNKEGNKEKPDRWKDHIRDIKATSKEYRRDAMKSARQGHLGDAVGYLGDSCRVGMLCTAARIVRAVHMHKDH